MPPPRLKNLDGRGDWRGGVRPAGCRRNGVLLVLVEPAKTERELDVAAHLLVARALLGRERRLGHRRRADRRLPALHAVEADAGREQEEPT